jgi:hypothetical protein
MATTIEDNGTKIKITSNGEVRNVIKSQIRDIGVIKTNIITIDIGAGALENIFIPFADVTAPSKPDPESLRDAILAFLETGGLAKEARQIEENGLLNDLKTAATNLQNVVSSIDSKNFYQPLMIDKSGANVVYRGYASVGTPTKSPLWAIEKVTSAKSIETHTWADGDMKFDNVWDNRETLIYK